MVHQQSLFNYKKLQIFPFESSSPYIKGDGFSRFLAQFLRQKFPFLDVRYGLPRRQTPGRSLFSPDPLLLGTIRTLSSLKRGGLKVLITASLWADDKLLWSFAAEISDSSKNAKEQAKKIVRKAMRFIGKEIAKCRVHEG